MTQLEIEQAIAESDERKLYDIALTLALDDETFCLNCCLDVCGMCGSKECKDFKKVKF